jgi:hypothetical protein
MINFVELTTPAFLTGYMSALLSKSAPLHWEQQHLKEAAFNCVPDVPVNSGVCRAHSFNSSKQSTLFSPSKPFYKIFNSNKHKR